MREANTFHRKEVIIDEPGWYIARNGDSIQITDIGDPVRASFNCHGYHHYLTPTGKKKSEWNIWAPNGAFIALGIHPEDVISKR